MSDLLNRYKRTNFYNTYIVEGNVENDLIENNFDLFKITRPVYYFTLKKEYIQRPDLLSIRLYGNQSYWWIILKVNNIDDPWNDIISENTIIVPDIRDIEDFYLNFKSKQNS